MNKLFPIVLALMFFGCDSPTQSNDSSYYDLYCSEGYVELWGQYYDIETTTELYLYNNGLKGIIPPHIGCLVNLTHLQLYNNFLTGEIPPEIGNLTNLTYLDLRYNDLSGEIPQAVCDLIESNSLDIYNITSGNDLTNTCAE